MLGDELVGKSLARLRVALLVDLVRLLDELGPRLGEDAEQVQEAGEAAHRGRSAAEPIEVDAIPRLVVIEQESIAVEQVA